MYYQVSWIPQATPHLIMSTTIYQLKFSRRCHKHLRWLWRSFYSWVSPTPALRLRPIAVAFDKLEELLVSHRQVLLGLDVDTRAMTVSITTQYHWNEVLSIFYFTVNMAWAPPDVYNERDGIVSWKIGTDCPDPDHCTTWCPICILYSSLAYALRIGVRVIKVTIYIEYIVFHNAMVEYALALLILLPCQVQCKEEKKQLACICIMKNKLSNWISIQSYILLKVGLEKMFRPCYVIILYRYWCQQWWWCPSIRNLPYLITTPKLLREHCGVLGRDYD